MEKSYNPLKMFGTYIGIILGVVAEFYVAKQIGEVIWVAWYIAILPIIITGFMGYGIHYFFRKSFGD